jgi:hypothetical protein
VTNLLSPLLDLDGFVGTDFITGLFGGDFTGLINFLGSILDSLCAVLTFLEAGASDDFEELFSEDGGFLIGLGKIFLDSSGVFSFEGDSGDLVLSFLDLKNFLGFREGLDLSDFIESDCGVFLSTGLGGDIAVLDALLGVI